MIIGNALRYSINSDAAQIWKNTDPSCHDYVLGDLKIIEDHTNIISAEIYTEILDIKKTIIKYDIQQINKTLERILIMKCSWGAWVIWALKLLEMKSMFQIIAWH